MIHPHAEPGDHLPVRHPKTWIVGFIAVFGSLTVAAHRRA
jgi:hypothetical protein